MDSVLYKSWRVNVVVSILQLLLGLAAFLQWNLAIAGATVGFVTLCSLIPVVENRSLQFCPRIEMVLTVNMLAAFLVAVAALAIQSYGSAGVLTLLYFFGVVVLMVAMLIALAFTTLYYRAFDNVPESLPVMTGCLLPAGIGAVFGAGYFLTRRSRPPVIAKHKKDDVHIDTMRF